MTDRRPPVPAARPDARRLVTGAKLATVVASAVGFGAVAGLILSNPIGVTATNGAAPGASSPAQATPAPAPAQDFFSAPPGFAQPPMIDGGASSGQGGFGGQMPSMRSGGS